ncbi:MAG: CDP-diacylglycerol--glycerol-3-phosphate 3-phosphatidyltransferase [Lachnospiraceae bacterium]|nr:CDP-diacylglycerol--glycerol-3-phosphate 3-phosphatidyltransferase [Lachnospiraceae bacterium]
MNLPNRLTILRVLMIPLFIVIFLNDGIKYNEYIASFVYIIACITDFFDGFIARKYNLTTNFGKFLDPLADKLLVNMALICFLVIPENPIPAWIVMIIISRDFIISGFRLVASDNGVVIAADYWGKVKTTVQMIMTVFLIINFDNMFINILEYILIYAALILTIISLCVCIYNNKEVLKDPIHNDNR